MEERDKRWKKVKNIPYRSPWGSARKRREIGNTGAKVLRTFGEEAKPLSESDRDDFNETSEEGRG